MDNKQKVSMSKRVTRIIFLVLYILTAGFLIVESLIPGEESAKQSGSVGQVVADVVNSVMGDQAKYVEPKSCAIESEHSQASIGDTLALNVKTTPDNSSYNAYTYKTSDSEIAIVDNLGNVTFLKEGEVTVTTTNLHNPKIKDKITFNVSPVEVEDVEIKIDTLKEGNVYTLYNPGEYRIDTIFYPKNTTDKSVTYELSDNASNYIAVVEDIVKVKAASNSDTFTVKVITSDYIYPLRFKTVNKSDSSVDKYLDKIDVNLLDKQDNIYDESNVILYMDNYVKVDVLAGDDITKFDYSYQVSDTEIATVKNNVVTPKAIGECDLTVTDNVSHLSKTIHIKVRNKIDISGVTTIGKFDLVDDKYVIINGTSLRVLPKFSTTSTFKEVTYTISDESVAEIAQDGTLITKGLGSVVVTLTSSDGMAASSQTVNIVINPLLYSDTIPDFFVIVRKIIGHFLAFTALGVFSTFTYQLYLENKKEWVPIVINYASGFAIALLTEFLQIFTPDRAGMWEDVFIDYGGFMISAFVLSAIFLFIRLKQKKVE